MQSIKEKLRRRLIERVRNEGLEIRERDKDPYHKDERK